MERKRDCKTFDGAECAYQQAQEYEDMLQNGFPQRGFMRFLMFVPIFIIDTRRLNLYIEADNCKSCSHKPKNHS